MKAPELLLLLFAVHSITTTTTTTTAFQLTPCLQGHDRQSAFLGGARLPVAAAAGTATATTARRRHAFVWRVSTEEEQEQQLTTTATATDATTRTNKSKSNSNQAAEEAAPSSAIRYTEIYKVQSQEPYWCYWSTGYELVQAGVVGSLTGLLVAFFKLSIEFVRTLMYEQDTLVTHPYLIALIPALGGVVVGLLLIQGGGAFPPGLRGTIQDIDEAKDTAASHSDRNNFSVQTNFLRKSTAAVATLGSGNSLGPEGPCVEIGLNVARACTSLNRPVPSREAGTGPGLTGSGQTEIMVAPAGDQQQQQQQQQSTPTTPSTESQREWNRILLSCGAAAGVAAGFNAPIAGVFFALEIMQNTFTSMDQERIMEALKQEGSSMDATTNGNSNGNSNSNSNTPPSVSNNMMLYPTMMTSMTSTTTVTPILISSVLSALLSATVLGNHLVLTLTDFDLETPLVELPLYLLLGALSGVVAFVFTYSAKTSQQFFAGEFGPSDAVKETMAALPDAFKPIIGGLLCGLVGLVFPQVLFFGYETLNALLNSDGGTPLTLVLSLMGVKTLMTAIAAGSGLVGGTFAPSLFLGGMLGCAFHEGATFVFDTLTNLNHGGMMGGLEIDAVTVGLGSTLHIAGVPAYAMVGAASVLAALFRAPLTASLLLFEVTRNYDVILPLMASAGVGSIVGDILEDRLERRDEMKRRDRDPVSWGDLSDMDERENIVSAFKSGLPTIVVPAQGQVPEEEKEEKL